MDEEIAMLSPKENEWILDKYSKEFLKHKSLEEILCLFPYTDRYFDDITVSSVIEVTSISVRNDEDDNHKIYDIYGTIQLIDWKGGTFDLYNRKRDNPETISNGDFLTITPPTGSAITATGLVQGHFDLFDANQDGAPIINTTFLWDPIMKDCYDEVRDHTQLFDTPEGGSAVIGFITYRHASVCNVDVEFLMDCADIYVYGEIIARAGKFSTVLFDRKQNESVNVKYGTNIQLRRRVVVLPPSCLSLTIHVKLFNGVTHEKFFEETTRVGIFLTNGSNRHQEPACDIINLQVRWTHPCLQPHLSSRVAPTNSKISPYRSYAPFGRKLLEIYSVSIAVGHMAEDMDIWGSIELSLLVGDSIFLFNEDKSSPQKLLPNEIVPLKSYTDCLRVSFSIKLELRDGNDRLISEGWVNWSDQTCIHYRHLLNTHLCSVVRSATGSYAAIYYSVFETGIQAIVKIYLNGKNSDMKCFNADGSVCAQYSGYDYSTLYQYEYFRKRLFVGKSTDPWLPYPCRNLLLSECSVIVPEGSSLMVDVNLNVIYSATMATIGDYGNMSDGLLQPRDSFEELVEFKYEDIDLSSQHAVFQKEIEGSSGQIVIQVEWKPVRY